MRMNKSTDGQKEIFLWKNRRLTAFQRALLGWYASCARDLPWRKTRDPYRIWVSEIMLQQTRVAAVLPFYLRFIERFPTPAALAETPLEEVLPFWSGLGYYRRIRHLHQAAVFLVKENSGRVPDSRDQLLALPGIGLYTAGAILSLAYGQAEPVLDGNVQRVYCRLLAIDRNPNHSPIQKQLWNLARHMLPDKQSGDFNQSLMELGATLCSPQDPDCRRCPVQRYCLAAKQGRQKQIPRRSSSPDRIRQELAVLLLQNKNRILLIRQEEKALVPGLWELPHYPYSETPPPVQGRKAKTVLSHPGKGAKAPEPTAEPAFLADLQKEYGCRVSSQRKIGMVKHSIMQRDLRLHVFHAVTEGPIGGDGNSRASQAWILPQEIRGYGVSSASLKALHLLHKAGQD
jgi:A/G-specific adenine glycosylase